MSGTWDRCTERIFRAYVENKTFMREETFVKLFIDHHLDDEELEPEDIRRIFGQVATNPKGLTLSQFSEAVERCAKRKGIALKVLEGIFNTCRGPKVFEEAKYLND